MKNLIYLKDFKDTVYQDIINKKVIANSCNRQTVLYCIDYHISKNLYYNKVTGKTFNNEGWLSEYVYKKDIPEYENDIECAYWAFANFICNSISRIKRGYKP